MTEKEYVDYYKKFDDSTEFEKYYRLRYKWMHRKAEWAHVITAFSKTKFYKNIHQ